MNFRRWSDLSDDEQVVICRERPTGGNATDLLVSIGSIMDEVRHGREEAVRSITERIDGVGISQVVHSVGAMASATDALLSSELKSALDLAIDRSRRYSRIELELAGEFRSVIGGDLVGQVLRPIESLAVYVPAGKGSFPRCSCMLPHPRSRLAYPRLFF